MSVPEYMVLIDSSDGDQNAVLYVDGQRVQARVLHWDSEDDNSDTILAAHYYCTLYEDEEMCGDDSESFVKLPDAWTAEEWQAILNQPQAAYLLPEKATPE